MIYMVEKWISTYLIVNLYVWFKKTDKMLWDSIECNSIGENSSYGYILGTDLKYPDEWHALHNDYASAPEKIS